jgi:hypothetical protein
LTLIADHSIRYINTDERELAHRQQMMVDAAAAVSGKEERKMGNKQERRIRRR